MLARTLGRHRSERRTLGRCRLLTRSSQAPQYESLGALGCGLPCRLMKQLTEAGMSSTSGTRLRNGVPQIGKQLPSRAPNGSTFTPARPRSVGERVPDSPRSVPGRILPTGLSRRRCWLPDAMLTTTGPWCLAPTGGGRQGRRFHCARVAHRAAALSASCNCLRPGRRSQPRAKP
jgi:hypothetical protein